MLSHLNTLIGFAALFALLSLIVTAVTQIVRTLSGMKPKTLVETLLRLFGEIEGSERFVAAILSHPTLCGQTSRKDYELLADPTRGNNDADVVKRTKAILEAYRSQVRRSTLGRRLKTVDLNKQAIKDIGSVVYERLAERIDPETPTDPNDKKDLRLAEWAAPFENAVRASFVKEQASPAAPGFGLTGPAAAPPGGAATVVPTPHFGRLWRLATAAFPEAKGMANPVKTYVAAFYDEAAASASDSFTLRIRIITTLVALILAFCLQLNAVDLWNQLSKADPAKVEKLATSAEKLERKAAPSPADAGGQKPDPGRPSVQQEAAQRAAGPTGAGKEEPNLASEVKELSDLAKELKASPVPLDFQLSAKLEEGGFWGLFKIMTDLGFWLAVVALSLGAPFWFETLKSAIKMKSAFTEDGKK